MLRSIVLLGNVHQSCVQDARELTSRFCICDCWQVAVKTLPFYKNYFNIAYPLPKMDLIAIADFAAGNTSHWTLLTQW